MQWRVSSFIVVRRCFMNFSSCRLNSRIHVFNPTIYCFFFLLFPFSFASRRLARYNTTVRIALYIFYFLSSTIGDVTLFSLLFRYVIACAGLSPALTHNRSAGSLFSEVLARPWQADDTHPFFSRLAYAMSMERSSSKAGCP